MRERVPESIRDSRPWALLRALLMPVYVLYAHRRLIRQFTFRDLNEKYRQTFLGLYWFVLTPLLYLTAFSFVFGYVLPGREATWQHLVGDELGFVVAIFSGLIVFWVSSETLVQSTNLIPQHKNLVTQLRFPTEMLVWSTLFTALFGFMVHCVFFMLLFVWWVGPLPWTVLMIPLVMLPLATLLMGLGWLLAAISAPVRDFSQLVAVGMTAMLFLSGVFYPASAVPEGFRSYFLLNPIARSIEDFRRLTFQQKLPVWEEWLVYMAVAALVMLIGYHVFKRMQPRFAEYI